MELGKIKKVTVIGSGLMGTGIAQVCAQSGYDVSLEDVSQAQVARGLDGIRESIKKHLVDKGKLNVGEAAELMLRIKGTTDLKEALKETDIVIEAIYEDMDLKKALFREADKIAPSGTVFASNTSSLLITEIASATGRPEKCIGMHWFYPPAVMKLVEVVRGLLTSEETYNTVIEFANHLGKVPVTVKDSPGFVVVRLLSGLIADAIRCVEEGLLSVEDLDKACRLGLNHPMGPLELGDYTGLDTYLRIFEYLYEVTGESRFKPPLLLRKMVASGHFGRKSGKGFYNYLLQ